MLLIECKKASIYSLQNVYLCDAAVSHIEEDSVTLTMVASSADFLTSEVNVTFYDAVRGLVTHFCALSNYKEFNPAPNTWRSSVHCSIGEQISVLQRRDDIKVTVELPIRLSFTNDEDILIDVAATIRNISAGGIFFTCRYPFHAGHEVVFLFSPRRDMEPLALKAEILRVQERQLLREMIGPEADDETLLGFGCHFIEMSPHAEAQVRNYVYRQDIIRHKGNFFTVS